MTHRYYGICCSNIGRVADIRTRDGRSISGKICGVTSSGVRISPVGTGISDQTKKNAVNIIGTSAMDTNEKKEGDEIFFFAPFFFPFVTIAALTIAAAATVPCYRCYRRPYYRRPYY